MAVRRVLFIVPPYYCFRDLMLQPPMATLGVLYLAGFVRKHGYEATVHLPDLEADVEPRFFLSMEDYTKGWANYGRYVRGEDEHTVWGRIAEVVKQVDPDIVAVSANTPIIDSAFRVTELIKAAKPDTPIVLGGFHGTFRYLVLMRQRPSGGVG